jgi:outer membrane protein OmpA-like peptidoglycan-associated protein
MSSRKLIAPVIATSIAALALASCTTAPENAELEQAHAALTAAQQDPAVASGGAGDLQAAKAYLDQADSVQGGTGNQTEVTHLAYMANQRVRIAYQTASLQRTMAELHSTPRAMAKSGNVYFKTGQASIVPGKQGTLDRMATFLQRNPDQRVRIEGYADSTGSNAVNKRLSQARADAVRDALVSRGVNASRIEANGNGDASPVASNNTAQGRQMNRRAVVMVSNMAASGSTTPPETGPTSGSDIR